ncbi:MAG TPA: MlaD family protein [Desulfobacterales bacterium]
MAKKTNKTLIGAFILGAVILVIAAVLALGGMRFFTFSQQLVMYFEGSVKGLAVGAPVQLKGVTVGQVKDIRLIFDSENLVFLNRVLAETTPGKVSSVDKIPEAAPLRAYQTDPQKLMAQLIDHGLRAQLALESIVTGKLLVSLNFLPDTPVTLYGFEQGTDVIEVPTVPTELEKIAQAVEKLSLEEMMVEVRNLVTGMNRFIQSQDLSAAVSGLNRTLQKTETMVDHINGSIQPVIERLDATLESYEGLARKLESRIDPVAGGIEDASRDVGRLARNLDRRMGQTLEDVRTALREADRALAALNRFANEDSRVQQNLVAALEELEKAAQSIRYLADYLNRHPEALLRGKPLPGER